MVLLLIHSTSELNFLLHLFSSKNSNSTKNGHYSKGTNDHLLFIIEPHFLYNYLYDREMSHKWRLFVNTLFINSYHICKMEFGERLKELRTSLNCSQKELSEKTGLTLRTIQRIENNEVKPSLYQ